MNYTTVTQPRYASADRKDIACLVLFEGMDAPMPFTAHMDDPEAHGQQLYAELTSLKYGQIGAYVAPAATPAEQYTAAIKQGVQVVCASAPDLNGTYGVAEADTADITSEAAFISIYQEFTNGDTSYGWPDAQGVRHTFPSVALFLQFAKGIAVYVSGCKQAAAALRSGALVGFPTNILVIG